MKNILLVYSTTDGQTVKIIEHIATQLHESFKNDINHDVQIKPLSCVESHDIDAANTIVIGASIRYGHHKKEVFEFIDQHMAQLTEKPSAFFSVNVVARKPDKNTPATNPYLQKFLTKTEWQPDLLGVFAGRLAYPEYGFIDKTMIRLIMKMTDGPTDPNKITEFTDWNKVSEFANSVASLSLSA